MVAISIPSEVCSPYGPRRNICLIFLNCLLCVSVGMISMMLFACPGNPMCRRFGRGMWKLDVGSGRNGGLSILGFILFLYCFLSFRVCTGLVLYFSLCPSPHLSSLGLSHFFSFLCCKLVIFLLLVSSRENNLGRVNFGTFKCFKI